MKLNQIVITAALRTAVGSLNRSLKNINAQTLGAEVISNLIRRSDFDIKTLMKSLWGKF